MTPFGFGVLCGAGGMFVLMVLVILFVNHGPGSPDWSDMNMEDEMKEASKLISRSVIDGVLWAAFILGLSFFLSFFAVTTIQNALTEYDDTDFNGSRSGLEILTDCRTGLQYLSTREGGLTPRLDADSTQIRKACK